MFLHRLRIRGKLGALVIVPLVVIAALSIAIVIEQASSARAASRTLRSVDVASQIGIVVADLQAERLDSIGYLVGTATPSDVATERAQVDEQISDVEQNYRGKLSRPLLAALNGVSKLDAVRQKIDIRTIATPDAIAGFSPVISALLNATHLVDGIDTSTESGREIVALDSLDHIDELTNESAAILLEIAGVNDEPIGPTSTLAEINAHNADQRALVSYSADQVAIASLLPRFTADATPDDVSLYNLVAQALIDRVGPDFATSFTNDPAGTAAALTAPVVFPQMQSFITLGRFAEQKIAADVVTAVGSQRDDTLLEAYATGAIGLIVVAGVALLGALIARSVAIPLADLTASTNRVAVLAEAELQRVADDEAEADEPIRFEPVQISSDDEIGELARAFERISTTAVQLVGRQVISRRNVAQMFGHVGRRTQNLVGRQIALIDALESQETDSSRLGELYRLDHLTSRLRRNASSLVALSGTSDSGGHFAPLPIVDVVRLALGEIEEYTRVDLTAMADLQITPSAINDLVLLLAEIMENSTTFSPPQTRVAVRATAHPPQLTITDQGIGLPPDRLAAENARFASRERLDLAPTEVLGLFVVGRLARRHGLGVVMTETPGGGVTVAVDVRNVLINRGPAPSPRHEDPAVARPFGPGSRLDDLRAPEALPAWRPDVRGAGPGTRPMPAAEPWLPAAAHAPVTHSPAAQPQAAQFRIAPPADAWPPEAPPLPSWPLESPASAAGFDAFLPARNGEPAAEPVAPFDAGKLDRANRAIESGRPWNAFELPTPALAATPYEHTTQAVADVHERRGPSVGGEPALSERTTGEFSRAAGDWSAPTVFASGAPLPRRGESEPDAGATAFEATQEVAPSAPRPIDERPENGLVTDREAQTIVLPAIAEGGPLTRRVPGATIRMDPVSTARQSGAPQDPDDVWNLVNQFESGVARALHEVRSEPTEEEPQT